LSEILQIEVYGETNCITAQNGGDANTGACELLIEQIDSESY